MGGSTLFLLGSGLLPTEDVDGSGDGFEGLSACDKTDRFVEKRAAEDDTSPLKALSWLFKYDDMAMHCDTATIILALSYALYEA